MGRVVGGRPTLWTAPGGLPVNAAHPLPLATQHALVWRAAVAGAARAAAVLVLLPAAACWRRPHGRPARPGAAWGGLAIMAVVSTLLLALGSGLVQPRLAALSFNPTDRPAGAVGGGWQPVVAAEVVTSALCWLATVWAAARHEVAGTPPAAAWNTVLLAFLYYLAPGWSLRTIGTDILALGAAGRLCVSAPGGGARHPAVAGRAGCTRLGR